jgi:DNA-binding NtrC family response regulator
MKVMIIDDDATTLHVLEAAIERLGHEVVVRDESLGTVNAVAKEKPDVAVLDVRMPGLGGDRLANLLLERNPALIVILHSSVPLPELERMARLCGAAGCIEKSGDPTKFADAFDRLVNVHAPKSRHVAASKGAGRREP